MSLLPPPPKRTVAPTPIAQPDPAVKETWKAWSKRKSSAWGQKGMVKGIAISDNVGGKANGMAAAIGSNAFWPVTGDFPQEMEKCARILRSFTVDGIEQTVEAKSVKGMKKQRKILKKIPARIIRDAKGLAIFTTMRTGMAPWAGAGGAGVLVAKLPDGSWSAPSAITPNNMSVGLMFGIDVLDCVLVIRTQKALDSFTSVKMTLGTEMALAAGPFGAGAALELGLDKTPLLTYSKSRGLYAGFELVANVFIARTEENEMMYFWPGIKPIDILTGKVKVPPEAASLQMALLDAETGRAQRLNGAEKEFEVSFPEVSEDLELLDGEVLRLPPTPDQVYEAEQEDERQRLIEQKKEDRKRLS